MPDIPLDKLDGIGPWGLAVLLVIAFITGLIVPGKDRDYWRKAFFEEQRMRQELETTALLARSVFRSIPTPPDEDKT